MTDQKTRRRPWTVTPPWLIIGAVVILAPIFIYMAKENIDRQRAQTTRLLMEKGGALIGSVEAGARMGIGMRWGGFQFEKFLIETAQQPDIDYLIVTDTEGAILADSDPSRIGMGYGLDLDLPAIARTEALAWRRVPNSEGADTFEVYRRFAPTGPLPGPPVPVPPPGQPEERAPGWVIFAGLDMGPLESAEAQERSRTIWLAVIFLLIGFAGIVSLLLAQGYRAARSSLSRIKAFSDSLVENMPIGLIAVDPAGTLTAFNRTAEAILGLKIDDVVGRPAAAALPGKCGEVLRQLTAGKRIIEQEIECTLAPGRTFLLETIATTLREEGGRFLGTALLFRDVTEMRRLKQEVARNRHMASIGSLAAGVAHEIRNPLSSIKGFATYFRERFRDSPADRETAEVMIREVDRLNRVISQLLEFARPLTMNRVPTALQPVIRNALKLVEGRAREKGIAIEADLPPEMGKVPVDPDRMGQVLLNLCLNAIEATGKGGMLRVSLARSEDGQVRIDVADTGTGIRPEDIPRVFDPYFTTKPSGTGLGLPIIQKIVEAHGGEVRIASEPGEGTTVTVLLPAHAETATNPDRQVMHS